MQLPFRRVLAMDAGSRRIKLAWMESRWGRLRILDEQAFDLREEGLKSADELQTHLQNTLEQLGHPPIALLLPQHLSTAQRIDLPPAPEEQARKLIEEETLKLGGVSESAIIYDFVRAKPAAPNRQSFWVTLCQEGEIADQIKRLGVENEDLCEVTTTANALISAYLAIHPEATRTVLAHAGAQSTVVAVVMDGQGVFASSFPMGGDFFTRAIAGQRKCPIEEAEAFKQTKNVFAGTDALPGFLPVVEGWLTELKQQLNEWFAGKSELSFSPPSFQVVASGGAFAQPGLLDYLNERSGLRFTPWPEGAGKDSETPTAGFEVAFGAALQALGRNAQPISLLPPGYRAKEQKRLVRKWIELANAAMLIMVSLLLIFGTWQKLSALHHKEDLLAKVQKGLDDIRQNETVTEQLLAEYERVRPLLERQKATLDTLKTLALLQQSRSNRPFWYVLFADQQSYFTETLPLGPIRPTSPTISLTASRVPPVLMTNALAAALTNVPVKPGFIAELCVPEEAETARRTFSDLVNDLKRDPMFSKVDSLSGDLRRNLADPKVVLPDRHFALALELADLELMRPNVPRKQPQPISTNIISRAVPRAPMPTPEATDFPRPDSAP